MACRLVAGVGAAGRGVARKVRDAGRPARPIKRKGSVSSGGGCEISRGVSNAGKLASQFWQRGRMGKARGCPQCAGCRKRKGHGDARCAPARQGWAGAAAAENSKQGNLAGGPGVLRTPGRRPPHRNGGTFGSFSHERTTIIREIVKKMTSNPTQKPSNKATPAKANKEKMQRPRRGRVRGLPQSNRPRHAR